MLFGCKYGGPLIKLSVIKKRQYFIFSKTNCSSVIFVVDQQGFIFVLIRINSRKYSLAWNVNYKEGKENWNTSTIFGLK